MIKEFQGEYRWLSNFWPVEINYNDRIFKSVEHAYMSEKNTSEVWKNFCVSENDPKIVKNMSKEINIREDWFDINLKIMEDIIRIKFSKEPLRTQLIETKEIELQEGNDWGDLYWGVDIETGSGENKLGKLIMKIRDESKNNE